MLMSPVHVDVLVPVPVAVPVAVPALVLDLVPALVLDPVHALLMLMCMYLGTYLGLLAADRIIQYDLGRLPSESHRLCPASSPRTPPASESQRTNRIPLFSCPTYGSYSLYSG